MNQGSKVVLLCKVIDTKELEIYLRTIPRPVSLS